MKLSCLLENTNIQYNQSSGKEFYWNFYDNEKGPDKTLFDRLPYLHTDSLKDEYVFYAAEENKVIGVAGIQQSPHKEEESILWIKFVSVDNNYKNKGIATKLLEMIFKYAIDNNKKLVRSTYTDDGFKYLYGVLYKLNKKYPEVLISSLT